MLRFLFSIFWYIGTLNKDFLMRTTVRMSYLHEHRTCCSVFCLTLSLSTVVFSRALIFIPLFTAQTVLGVMEQQDVVFDRWLDTVVLVTIVIVSIYKNKSNGQHKKSKEHFQT